MTRTNPRPKPVNTASSRGNKAALPSKPCAACALPMTWRRRWARTWDMVKYCSDACRRRGAPAAGAHPHG